MIAQHFHLNQHDIWVFGGAGYHGQSMVKQFATMQARVLCVDLEGLAAAMIETLGLQIAATAASLDAADTTAVEQFVIDQIAARGVPNCLVVMTYASTAKRFDHLSVEDFDHANHGNLTATFALARAVGQRMAEQGRGSIVLFSSIYGSVSPDPSVYAALMHPNPIEYGVARPVFSRWHVTWPCIGARKACSATASPPVPSQIP